MVDQLEEAKELAESLIRNAPRWDDNEKPVDPDVHRLWVGYGVRVSEALVALLTEHSAREEAMRQIQAVAVMAQNHHVTTQTRLWWLREIENRARATLPATESAQPEPERYVGSPAPPLPQRAERKEEPDMKSLVAWFVQTKLGQKLIGWLFRGTEDM